MAVIHLGNQRYSCLYTDTKPTGIPAGAIAFETDTLDMMEYDGTYWWLIGAPAAGSPRKWGSIPMGGAGTTGMGATPASTAATGTGANTDVVSDVNGRYRNFLTLTTTADRGGQRISNANFTSRQHNPKLRFKFQMPAAADYTLARLFIGLGVNTEPSLDDTLNAVSGVYIGFISGGTNFIVQRNDGTGATDVSGDVAASAQALDTAVHTVSIVYDEATPRVSVKWDLNAYVHFTTDIPAATTNQTIHYINQTNENTVAKAFRVFYLWFQSEK